MPIDIAELRKLTVAERLQLVSPTIGMVKSHGYLRRI